MSIYDREQEILSVWVLQVKSGSSKRLLSTITSLKELGKWELVQKSKVETITKQEQKVMGVVETGLYFETWDKDHRGLNHEHPRKGQLNLYTLLWESRLLHIVYYISYNICTMYVYMSINVS